MALIPIPMNLTIKIIDLGIIHCNCNHLLIIMSYVEIIVLYIFGMWKTTPHVADDD